MEERLRVSVCGLFLISHFFALRLFPGPKFCHWDGADEAHGGGGDAGAAVEVQIRRLRGRYEGGNTPQFIYSTIFTGCLRLMFLF